MMQTTFVSVVRSLAIAAFVTVGLAGGRAWAAEPVPIRVVVVTMFEIGEDTGDKPGEFQTWVEKFPLPEILPFPEGTRHLRFNPEKGVLAMVTGIGTARSAASVMALGLDPRFDLSRAYWLVAGIAGANPNAVSLGSAAWAEWIVDGDLAHEIDPREAPAAWTTGYLPLERKVPFEKPRNVEADGGAVYRLDPAMVDWAWRLTRDIPLGDSEPLRQRRASYIGYPKAQEPPAVIKGDTLSAMTFWHGKLLNQWAIDWVKYWTDGAGTFATTAMEDTGTLQSLTLLANAGKVDRERILVVRTASNFSMPPDGRSAAESLAGEGGGYSAFLPSLDAAYRVGSKVANEIAEHWGQYRDELPGGGK